MIDLGIHSVKEASVDSRHWNKESNYKFKFFKSYIIWIAFQTNLVKQRFYFLNSLTIMLYFSVKSFGILKVKLICFSQ